MTQFSQKYTIIQLLEAAAEGTQFSSDSWPLHATIVDTFAIDWTAAVMIEKLEKLLAVHEQATSIAAGDELLGLEKQVQVVLIRKTDSLAQLHKDVIELLEHGGLRLNNPQFAREGFLPHSTVQKHARLHEGDVVTFNALTIVDMFPGNDPYQRKIIKTIGIDLRI